MSAHFDGGAEIAGRRLREVVVQYVDDPTLNLDGEDSDSCPPSPPPTYYLRVREEKQCPRAHSNGDSHEERIAHGEQAEGRESSAKAWAWRYVNVEKKSLLVWNRRGGKLLSSIPLADIASLRVISDEDAPGSILEVHIDPAPGASSDGHGKGSDGTSTGAGNILILQARSRRETLLWAKVLQENIERMTKRVVALENLDEHTNLSDVQELAKLLTHQLSALQQDQRGLERRSSGGSESDERQPEADKSRG